MRRRAGRIVASLLTVLTWAGAVGAATRTREGDGDVIRRPRFLGGIAGAVAGVLLLTLSANPAGGADTSPGSVAVQAQTSLSVACFGDCPPNFDDQFGESVDGVNGTASSSYDRARGSARASVDEGAGVLRAYLSGGVALPPSPLPAAASNQGSATAEIGDTITLSSAATILLEGRINGSLTLSRGDGVSFPVTLGAEIELTGDLVGEDRMVFGSFRRSYIDGEAPDETFSVPVDLPAGTSNFNAAIRAFTDFRVSAGHSESGTIDFGSSLAFQIVVPGGVTATSGSGLLPGTSGRTPRLSVADAQVVEGNDGESTPLSFPVSLSESSSEPVTVDYATADDSANAGTDYEATSGTLTFAPGETSKSVSVPVIGDLANEGVESFRVELGNAVGAVIQVGTAIGTIVDDESPVNNAPLAHDDAYVTDEDVPLSVDAPGVLANDSDPDGDVLLTAQESGPAHGTLSLSPFGSFTYTPEAGFSGPDSFTYSAGDGRGSSSVATVSITVNSVNDAPVAQADSYATEAGVPLSVAPPGVLGNDSDTDGDALEALLVSGPAHGALSLNANGSFTYMPNAGFSGSDSFIYRANDGRADSGEATVSLTVRRANAAPVAQDDAYATDAEVPLIVDAPGVLGNDSDPDGDALVAMPVLSPANGTLTMNEDGSFTYTPNPGFWGLDSFMYRATDGRADSSDATVSLTVRRPNDAPVANDDAYATDVDVPLSVDAPGVLANDTDADGDALEALLVAGPAHGSLNLNPNGSFTYTPEARFSGPDSFIYRANDGRADSGEATVSLTVRPPNNAPVAQDDAYATDADTPLSVVAPGVLTNDTDADGDALSVLPSSDPAHGTLTLYANGSFTYTPEAGFSGLDEFTYRATDGRGLSSPATVSLTVRPVGNTPPGSNVVVDLGAVKITFANVTQGGETTVSESAAGPEPPPGFRVLGGYFELATTATFDAAEVCFTYAGLTVPEIVHFDENGVPQILITTRDTGQEVCAEVTSFSPFALVVPVDTVPPRLTLPASLIVDATSPAGATVTYEASASDEVDPNPALECAPVSASTFAIGQTTVTCTATDAAGNSASGSFLITVRGAPAQIVALIEKTLLFLDLPPLEAALKARLEQAAAALVAKNQQAACRALDLYIAAVRAAPPSVLTAAEKAELVADARRIKAVIGCP